MTSQLMPHTLPLPLTFTRYPPYSIYYTYSCLYYPTSHYSVGLIALTSQKFVSDYAKCPTLLTSPLPYAHFLPYFTPIPT